MPLAARLLVRLPGLPQSQPFPKLKLDIAGQSENGSDNGIRRDRDEVRHKI